MLNCRVEETLKYFVNASNNRCVVELSSRGFIRRIPEIFYYAMGEIDTHEENSMCDKRNKEKQILILQNERGMGELYFVEPCIVPDYKTHVSAGQ